MKIVLSAVLAMMFLGCGDNDSKNEAKLVQEVKKEIQKPIEKVVEKEEIPQVAKKVVVTPEIPKSVEEIVAKEEVPKKVQAPKAPVTPEIKKVAVQKTIAPTPLKTGKDVFATCAGCHGANADKPALGKSQIIKGWDALKVAQVLNGYKDGSYGGPMKAVMKGQASKLSDQEIKLVADYISKL